MGGIVKQKINMLGLEVLDSYNCTAMSSVLEVKRWPIKDSARGARGRRGGALEIVLNISDQ